MKDYEGVFFRPVTVKNNKKTVKATAGIKLNLSRFSRHTKIVSPNADLLAAFPFLGASLVESDSIYYPFDVSQPKLFGAVPSLAGILRALVVMKYRYPEVYKKFFKLARYLSYEFDEETLKVPPFHLLMGYSHRVIDLAWKLVEAETGVTKELYAYAVVLGLERMKIEGWEKRVVDEVSLFSPNPEEDKEKIRELKLSLDVPDWFKVAVEETEREEVALDALNYTRKGEEKDISELLRKTLEEVRKAISSLGEDGNEEQIS